jgi:hypothetical protein
VRFLSLEPLLGPVPSLSRETHCEVVAAEPGKEFAWIVGGKEEGWTRCGYTFTPSAVGATVEESWAVVRLHPMMEELPEERLLGLIDQSREGIADTLANFKRVAEAS